MLAIPNLARTLMAGLVAAGVMFFAAGMTNAEANPRYAAIVMHSDSGDVLFARYADSHRYPASLTKVMTLYMLFDALEAGEVALDDDFFISKRAAGQPPSKLGVKSGGKIKVETAIKALVVRSANDVATVVAENLAGTEYKFAIEMTKRARSLGMKRTVFRNASGLPNSKQLSTARDMATLAQRIAQDHPKYFHYFDARKVTYGSKTYKTHNRVLLSYKGADGLKTGYTRRSGFNLTTTAKRGDHKLIGVVMGGRTSRTRDAHMVKILDRSFARLRSNPGLLRRAFAASPEPRLKPNSDALATTLLASAEVPAAPTTTLIAAAAAPQTQTTDPLAALIASTEAEADPIALAMHTPAMTLPLGEVLPQGDASDGVEAEPTEPPVWMVQIGAYASAELAAKKLRDAGRKTGEEIGDAPWAIAPYQKDGRTFYRARFVDFSEEEAESACLNLRKAGYDCLKVR